jgi:hypothetical protein
MRGILLGLFFASVTTACAAPASASVDRHTTVVGRTQAAKVTTTLAAYSRESQATLQKLTLNPADGVEGTSVAYHADGLTPDASLQLVWQSWDGSCDMTTSPETVQYNRRQFAERDIPLGSVVVAADGTVDGQFTVPDDFGETHNAMLLSSGLQVARAGFQERVQASITPSSGPVGTPIHIHVSGLAAMQFSGLTLAVRWDNTHTGLVNGTLNHGTAEAVIRASGPPGEHEIILNAGGAPAYLNIAQSPYAFFYNDLPDKEDIKLPFTVTADDGPPPNTLDWPDPSRVTLPDPGAPRTTTAQIDETGVRATFDNDEGPVLSEAGLNITGLAAGQPVQLTWMTAVGNRVTPGGWSLRSVPLTTGAASDAGDLKMPVTIPDDLGGWHEVQVSQNGRLVGQAPYFVDRSIASITPSSVKAGDTITVHLKGFGWTELDNGAAVTYDNASVGYVCGFNSSGDVVLQMTATGSPGTHLIDLYPMVYQGRNDIKPWYLDPVLSYGTDFPAQLLGYRLPAFRLAVTIQP